MNKRKQIPKEISEYLKYVSPLNPQEESGLVWIKSLNHMVPVGSRAGKKHYYKNVKSHYWVVQFKNERYMVHNIIWVLNNGEISDDLTLDHMNNITLDNRLENLIPETKSKQNFNKKKFKNNTSGLRGICYRKRDKHWEVVCRNNNKSVYLGAFKNFEDAAVSRIKYMISNYDIKDYKNELDDAIRIFPNILLKLKFLEDYYVI